MTISALIKALQALLASHGACYIQDEAGKRRALYLYGAPGGNLTLGTGPQPPIYCQGCQTCFEMLPGQAGWANHTELETLFCCEACHETYMKEEGNQ